MDYRGEDIDDIIDYKQYGCCVYKNKLKWSDTSSRTDIILFNEDAHSVESNKDLKFDTDLYPKTKEAVTKFVKDYWTCFSLQGQNAPFWNMSLDRYGRS